MSRWAPLRMSCFFRRYMFGERLIPEMLGKRGLPAEGRIAETWEISDEGENKAVISGGEFDGQTLHEATLAHPEEIVGPGWSGPHFPLLAKFLDASHMLPVHLHADDETARRRFGASHGKSEAWHILWAGQGATILAGIKPGVSRDDLIAAFRAQDYDAVMPRHPIAAGDTVYVPGGILHSFGPGTLIFEIQQTSDLASDVMPADVYGVHRTDPEWDRVIETTLSQLKSDYLPEPFAGIRTEQGGNRFSLGCACKHFALERWTLTERHALDGLDGLRTVSNVGGPLTIEYEGGEMELAKGESCVIPAAIGPHVYRPGADGADLIVCCIPDQMNPVYEPFFKRQPSR